MPRTLAVLFLVTLALACAKGEPEAAKPLTDPIEIVKAGYLPGIEDRTIGEFFDLGKEFEVNWKTRSEIQLATPFIPSDIPQVVITVTPNLSTSAHSKVEWELVFVREEQETDFQFKHVLMQGLDWFSGYSLEEFNEEFPSWVARNRAAVRTAWKKNLAPKDTPIS